MGPFIALDKCLLSSQPVKAEMCVQLSCLHWLGNFKDTCFCFVWFLANQSREQLLHKNPIPATSQSMVQIQSKSNSKCQRQFPALICGHELHLCSSKEEMNQEHLEMCEGTGYKRRGRAGAGSWTSGWGWHQDWLLQPRRFVNRQRTLRYNDT